jgi:hypothetical protein
MHAHLVLPSRSAVESIAEVKLRREVLGSRNRQERPEVIPMPLNATPSRILAYPARWERQATI